MQRAYALFAAFRVDVAAGGLGYGDVFRSPRLRVNLAAEARLKPLKTLESRHSCEWWFLRKLKDALS